MGCQESDVFFEDNKHCCSSRLGKVENTESSISEIGIGALNKKRL